MSILEYKIDGELYVALEDHIAEVVLLVERIKTLKAALIRSRMREEAQSRAVSRQARWDSDYVPYGEDERE